jgi:hypothetical protein
MDQSTLTVLTAFVVVTAFAVVIQMGILVALFLSVRKTSAQVLTLAAHLGAELVPRVHCLPTRDGQGRWPGPLERRRPWIAWRRSRHSDRTPEAEGRAGRGARRWQVGLDAIRG